MTVTVTFQLSDVERLAVLHQYGLSDGHQVARAALETWARSQLVEAACAAVAQRTHDINAGDA